MRLPINQGWIVGGDRNRREGTSSVLRCRRSSVAEAMENDDVDMQGAENNEEAVRIFIYFVHYYSFLNFLYLAHFVCQNWMQDLDDMKKRLKEMEDEAAALREMQAKVEKEMGAVQGFLFLLSSLFLFNSDFLV